jgi:hypothetical protein
MLKTKASGVARALSAEGVEYESGDYKPESILLTGGAGFIASHVVNLLCTRYPETKVCRGAISCQCHAFQCPFSSRF